MRYQLKPNRGRHILRNGAKRLDVYPGQIVDTKDWPVPEGMKAHFLALDPEPAPASPPKSALLQIKQRPDHRTFDVLHPVTGKPINSRPLKKAEAEVLAKEWKDPEPAPKTTPAPEGDGDAEKKDPPTTDENKQPQE